MDCSSFTLTDVINILILVLILHLILLTFLAPFIVNLYRVLNGKESFRKWIYLIEGIIVVLGATWIFL